jgi:hypothetical protein
MDDGMGRAQREFFDYKDIDLGIASDINGESRKISPISTKKLLLRIAGMNKKERKLYYSMRKSGAMPEVALGMIDTYRIPKMYSYPPIQLGTYTGRMP